VVARTIRDAPARLISVCLGINLALDDVRACVGLSARALADPDLQVIDGRSVLSDEEARALYADDLHPGPDGYRLIADRLAPLLSLPL
jgi:hypothetical protein